MDGDDAHRIIDSDEGFQLLLIFFEAFGILLRINLSAGDILEMWRGLVAVLVVAGVVCVSVSQTPKAVSSYTLESW